MRALRMTDRGILSQWGLRYLGFLSQVGMCYSGLIGTVWRHRHKLEL